MTDTPTPQTMASAEAEALSEHLWCIDTEQVRPRMAAAYLVGDGEHFAFIESGTNAVVPKVLALLDRLGIAREQISHVVPTHVHLDHAGGAGLLVASLPQAKLVIHPRGARHMIDPSALWQGVVGVYGEDNAQRMYGELVPVPEARVQVAGDGDTIHVGRRALEVMDSPGHARHHFSLWDAQTRGWFTGDTFGLSYRELDGPQGPVLIPTTTPVQFEPEAWQRTIDGYLARTPDCMYLTHYSRVRDVPRLAADLRAQLDCYVDVAQARADADDRHAALLDGLRGATLAHARARGCPLDDDAVLALLHHDLELNAQGLGVWLDRAAKQ